MRIPVIDFKPLKLVRYGISQFASCGSLENFLVYALLVGDFCQLGVKFSSFFCYTLLHGFTVCFVNSFQNIFTNLCPPSVFYNWFRSVLCSCSLYTLITVYLDSECFYVQIIIFFFFAVHLFPFNFLSVIAF